MLEGRYHLSDGGIHERELARHAGSRSACGIGVPTENLRAFNSLDQLLADADRLEIHAKDYGDGLFGCPEVDLPLI